MIKTSIPELIIEHISGNCPIQAEGTIAGEPFYFRARGGQWYLLIGTFDKPIWQYTRHYGSDEFSAGWMTEEEALGFLEESITIYKK